MKHLSYRNIDILSKTELRNINGGSFLGALAIWSIASSLLGLFLIEQAKNCRENPNCNLGGSVDMPESSTGYLL